jgi:hypothetical protein
MRDTATEIRGSESRRDTNSTKGGNLIIGNRVKKHRNDTLSSNKSRSISNSPMRNNLINRLKKSSRIESTGKVNRRLGFESRRKENEIALTEP